MRQFRLSQLRLSQFRLSRLALLLNSRLALAAAWSVLATAPLAAAPLATAIAAVPASPSQVPLLLALFVATVAAAAAAAWQVSAFLAARHHARSKQRQFVEFGHALTEAAREIGALAAAQSDAAREARTDADKAAHAAARAGSALADAEAQLCRFVQRAEQGLHSATETLSAAAGSFAPLAALARDLPQSVEEAVAGASRAAAEEAASHFAAADVAAADAAAGMLARAEDALAAIEAMSSNAGRFDAPIERLEAAAAQWEAGVAEIVGLQRAPPGFDTSDSDGPDAETLAAAVVAATESLQHAKIILDAQALAATQHEAMLATLLSRLEALATATDATLSAAYSGTLATAPNPLDAPNPGDLVQATANAAAALDRVSAVISPLADAWPALARAALNSAETLRRQSDEADRMAAECQTRTAQLLDACANVASAGIVLPAITAALSAAIEAPAFQAISVRGSEVLRAIENGTHALEDSAAQITTAVSRACESASAISEQMPARVEQALAPSIGAAAHLADRLSLALERASLSMARPPVDWVQAAETFAARSAETLAVIAKSIVCATETRLESAVDQALARLPILETMIEDRLVAGVHLAGSELAASQLAASNMMEHAASELRADCADALAAARRIMTATAEAAAGQADVAAQITAALSGAETASRAGHPQLEARPEAWPAAWTSALAAAMQPMGAALERVVATGEAQDRASARVMDAIRQVEAALTVSQPSSVHLNPRRSSRDTVALVRQVAEAAKALQGETEIMALAAHGGRRDLPTGDVSAVPAMLQDVGGAIAQLQDAATALALVCDLSAAA